LLILVCFAHAQREQKALELARTQSSLIPPTCMPIALAWAHAMMKQYGQAELHMQVACELNPYDSWTAISAALLLAFCGHSNVHRMFVKSL